VSNTCNLYNYCNFNMECIHCEKYLGATNWKCNDFDTTLSVRIILYCGELIETQSLRIFFKMQEFLQILISAKLVS
ncbi:hypothetical protein L9F63_024011, partial [Diploptera punctata]